jgi:hypothetical protein
MSLPPFEKEPAPYLIRGRVRKGFLSLPSPSMGEVTGEGEKVKNPPFVPLY